MGETVWSLAEAARKDLLSEPERRALLDALDAVPRAEHNRECNDLAAQHMEHVTNLRDRAERAEARAKGYHKLVDRYGIHDGGCPAWKGGHCSCGFDVAVSADADADAEPERRSPHVGYKSRIEYRPEDCPCGPNYLSIICEQHGASTEPSRAEGDAHAFAPVDTPDAVDPHTCHRCGEGRFHPSHLDPREGLDPDERLASDREGDDGRSRAIDAAHRRMKKVFVMGSDKSRAEVAEIIDAALASGHVVTREQYARDTAFIRAQVNARQDRAREDAKRWEAIIRDLDPYCPTGCGVCPDCRALQVVERAGQEADHA